MRILVSGSSGFIGTALCAVLGNDGHDIRRLVRGKPAAHDISWAPYAGTVDVSKLENFDAVIHLGGRSIAGSRWTSSSKREILESRTIPTAFLATQLAGLHHKPGLFLCASAVGYYGDRPDEHLDESSSPGTGFLSDVCVAWESACRPAVDAGIRTVNLRIGMVLSAGGGALVQMLTPFRIGFGGRLGSGKQYWSWITLTDLVSCIRLLLTHNTLSGPVNAVTPHPVTNAEFTTALANTLRRPAIFPAPALALRILLGEMAEPLLLASARVAPCKLLSAGFAFSSPDLEPALRQLLSK